MTVAESQPANAAHFQGQFASKIKDQTAEKISEDFFNFLDNFVAMEIGNASNARESAQESFTMMMSDLPSSEMPHQSAQHSSSNHQGIQQPTYVKRLMEMYQSGSNTLFVSFIHVLHHDDVLATAISEGYYRFEPFLRSSLFSLVQKHIPSYATIGTSERKRDFFVGFHGISLIYRLRELSTPLIGQLITMSGTVTRTSEVRPELLSGTFQCLVCGAVLKGVTQQFKYTEPTICTNRVCSNRLEWRLITEQSLFVDWQRVRVQENAQEIPPGNMPRTMDIIVRNDLCERAKPGDKINFTGCLIVVPDVSQLSTLPATKIESPASQTGRSQMGFASAESGGGTSGGIKGLGVREMTYKLSFLASFLESASSNGREGESFLLNDDSVSDEATDPALIFSPQELIEIEKMKQTPQIYQKLIDSFAPSIFGHSEIKAGILLMLFGGVHKTTNEGVGIRGDINICIVGDPGTAKSQFLKYVTGFLPRSVYTSGKSSSAAGLTASVMKDEESGEFTVEAGALMLADNGICAIDEFDKMDIADQVAIHEAMEQQTISISKAGIQATLNARTCILAAANPAGGRYDKKKTLRQNINMSAPIMSRFDLFFVLIDQCDETTDYMVAKHILTVHRLRDEAIEPVWSAEQIQRYIRYCKMIKPKLTPEAVQMLVERYKQLRQSDVVAGSSYRMTVRQLESMIRLSEALARLHADSEIKVKYVQEACRFLKSSIIRVDSDSIDLSEDAPVVDGARLIDSQSENTTTTTSTTSTTTTLPTHNTISFEEFNRCSSLLIYQLKKHEALAAQEEDVGMKRSALVEWYLTQLEAEIHSEADLQARTAQVMGVIHRLTHKDCILIELVDDEAGEGSTADPYLVVHPNYVTQ